MRRRISREYSMAFLAVVLAAVCLWTEISFAFCSWAQQSLPEASLRRLEMDLPDRGMTMDQRRKGGVLLHCLGLFYTFVAIAIVCDECFVPSLEVITEVLHLTPDVAGATFMAAGGSAPEFFTSLIGAVLVESDIGTGTIIGSAVFNVLFVIGACALVAPEPLSLTWFPLARDSSFYAIDLVVVTIALLDEQVRWFEAMILLSLYIAYTTFMKFNGRLEAYFMGGEQAEGLGDVEAEQPYWATSRKDQENGKEISAGTGEVQKKGLTRSNTATSGVGDGQGKLFRHKSLRVNHAGHGVRHVGTEEVQEITAEEGEHPDLNGSDAKLSSTGGTGHVVVPEQHGDRDFVRDITPESEAHPGDVQDHMDSVIPQISEVLAGTNQGHTSEASGHSNGKGNATNGASKDDDNRTSSKPSQRSNGNTESEEEEEENEPLSFALPGSDATFKEWFNYLFTLPIVFVLVCTVPDVRREGFRKFFVLTFCISILHIAFFTSVMVWFTQIIARTMDIPDHILAITVLAAGTSVPDLLTSMIVARQGQGDMAVSSSIGSNIFDVTVGLPVPWLLYAMVRSKPVQIRNEGLEISVMLLLAMLGFTIGTIMTHRWVMTKWMGASLLGLYFVFQAISISLTFVPKDSLKLIDV